MSDQQMGPGWWRASDGKWYPPEAQPGPPAAGWDTSPRAGDAVTQQRPTPGWYPDPSGRFAKRYFDSVWTEHVANQPGQRLVDPLNPAPSPASPVAARGRTGPWAKFRSWPLWLQVTCWAFLALVVIGAIGSGTDPDEAASTAPTTEEPDATTTVEPPRTTAAPAPTTAAPPTTAPPPTEPPETVSQQNARASAASYLDFQSFSRTGLIEQLMYEGFSQADATYGVDALAVDWNEQAALTAAGYLDFQAFSRSGLIDQLVYEGFSQAEAEYGVNTTGL